MPAQVSVVVGVSEDILRQRMKEFEKTAAGKTYI